MTSVYRKPRCRNLRSFRSAWENEAMRRQKLTAAAILFLFKRHFFESSVIWFVEAFFLLRLQPIRKSKSWEISACEATRARLMDGGYYLWNTAVPVIDSALYLLLIALGNVLPAEELCCDVHSWAFNMKFNDKYEKLTAVFVPQTYYTHSRGAKTIWETWIGPKAPESKANRKISPFFWHRRALCGLNLVNTQTLIVNIQIFKS